MNSYRHVLVATDFGPAAETAVDHALMIAKTFGAKVTLLHCTWLPPYYYSAYAEGIAWPTSELEVKAKEELEGAVANARMIHSKVESMLVAGDAWTEICKAAKERGADLVVVGTHGRRGLPRVFLGSVAERVVRMSDVPVLTVSVRDER
jgi:nucleotide-binding universal stress UspA family protein